MKGGKSNDMFAGGCRDFTSFPAELGNKNSDFSGVGDWDRPSEEYKLTELQRQLFGAIVKDLVRGGELFTKAMIRIIEVEFVKQQEMNAFRLSLAVQRQRPIHR